MARHGSHLDPPNRFEQVHAEPDLEHLAWDDQYLEALGRRDVEYLPDATQSIVTQNDSPDVPFRYSINPYRGCMHGCSYCYARNSHEYLGLNAGRDFETKIFVKENAPELLRKFLARPAWKPEPIIFSGITDCYQPAERKFRLTRGCLAVAWEHRQPVSIITKNALVLRDLDLLRLMAAQKLVQVNLSITTLEVELARVMEPAASTPEARLRAVRELSEAGVPVRVMVAPIIPGINDREIPAVLTAVKQAGAGGAGYVLLRLPLTVEPVFREWLERTHPLAANKVEGLVRSARRGKTSSSRWGERMVGTGEYAEQIRSLFKTFSAAQNFSGLPELDASHFQRPESEGKQLRLF